MMVLVLMICLVIMSIELLFLFKLDELSCFISFFFGLEFEMFICMLEVLVIFVKELVSIFLVVLIFWEVVICIGKIYEMLSKNFL